MLVTRRQVLTTVGAALVSSAAPMRLASATAITPGYHRWDDGGVMPYEHDPRKPLLGHHIKWGARVDDAFLEEIENDRFAEEEIADGAVFHGMYFGNDRPLVGQVVALVSSWEAKAPRSMRIYFVNGVSYGDEDIHALYMIPDVCGNPSWKMLQGKQPLCIPRPEQGGRAIV